MPCSTLGFARDRPGAAQSRTNDVDPDSPPQDAADRDQWERARRTWELSITVSAEALSSAQRSALFRALRIKRFEREACLAGMPGPLRSGAFVDLDPLRKALEESGVPCLLAPRAPTETATRSSDTCGDEADPTNRV